MKKRVTLLAYEIQPTESTGDDFNLPSELERAIKKTKSVSARSMPLASLDPQPECDFIISHHKTKSTIFGCLVRMKAGDAAHILKDQLSRPSIALEELVAESQDGIEGFAKDTTFFLADKKHLILKGGHIRKKAIQIYINWLMNLPDGDSEICTLIPKLGSKGDISVADVSLVEISESHFAGKDEYRTVSRNLDTIKGKLLQEILVDMPDMGEMLDDNLVSATIQLHFHVRREKKEKENATVIKALLNAADAEDIRIKLKDGNRVAGSTFEEKKVVEIELSDKAFLNEKELEAEMGAYARELD